MRLARFFHRARDNDGRKILLITESGCAEPSRPIVMGSILTDPTVEFLRRDYPRIDDAISAFNSAAERLLGEGYREAAETDYVVSKLPAEPAEKPEWQRVLDKLLLALFLEDGSEQSRRLGALARTAAEAEPLYRWAAAYRAAATGAFDRNEVLAMAKEAQRLLAERPADRPPYTWSLPLFELEAWIDDLLCECHLALDDPHAGLAAAQNAQDTSPDPSRGGRIAWILCEHFPEHQEEAFEKAYRDGELGGYEAVKQKPGYADYVRRAEKARRADKDWRWGARNRPASESELREAERNLGAALPPDYRRFLTDKGPAELLIAFDDHDQVLRFLEPSDLARQRDYFFDYMVQRSPRGEAFFWKDGLLFRDLVPVATPRDESSHMLLHIGAGEHFGRCYLWHHDDHGELMAAQPSFDAAIAALSAAIERRDPETMLFLGICLESE